MSVGVVWCWLLSMKVLIDVIVANKGLCFMFILFALGDGSCTNNAGSDDYFGEGT